MGVGAPVRQVFGSFGPDDMRVGGGAAVKRGRRGSLFSFQCTASGSVDNVGFLTSDLVVCTLETLTGVGGDGGFYHRASLKKNKKNKRHPLSSSSLLGPKSYPACIVAWLRSATALTLVDRPKQQEAMTSSPNDQNHLMKEGFCERAETASGGL